MRNKLHETGWICSWLRSKHFDSALNWFSNWNAAWNLNLLQSKNYFRIRKWCIKIRIIKIVLKLELIVIFLLLLFHILYLQGVVKYSMQRFASEKKIRLIELNLSNTQKCSTKCCISSKAAALNLNQFFPH